MLAFLGNILSTSHRDKAHIRELMLNYNFMSRHRSWYWFWTASGPL